MRSTLQTFTERYQQFPDGLADSESERSVSFTGSPEESFLRRVRGIIG